MTIEDDPGNPWRWIATVKPGDVVEIVVADRFGPMVLQGAHFQNDDGRWYRIDPPLEITLRVVAWRVGSLKTGAGHSQKD